ncbi:MAG TPA: Crp/Fnr family transcriptional regulator [Candidatus Methylomirabilis sp.]|jgi:CRP/FNR family transcriptional regulator
MRARAQEWADTAEGRARALAAVPYFAELGAADLQTLAADARLVRAVKGEVIFEEGSPCGGLYVIAAGCVRVLKRSAGGREQVLHRERGGALGEGPLLDGEPYPASAEALEPAALLFLPRESVLAWCRRRPEVAIGIARALARRVRRFAALAEDLALREVGQRLAGYLVARAGEDGRAVRGGLDLVLKESNQEIATQIGTVRELVSRALAGLRREGLIRLSGRRVTILDLERLRARGGAG